MVAASSPSAAACVSLETFVKIICEGGIPAQSSARIVGSPLVVDPCCSHEVKGTCSAAIRERCSSVAEYHRDSAAFPAVGSDVEEQLSEEWHPFSVFIALCSTCGLVFAQGPLG